MRLRSLSVVLLAATALVSAPATAAAADQRPTASSGTFKTSAIQRAQRPPAPAATSLTAPRPVTYSDRVLALTNAERTGRGLRPLAFSRCADGFADRWSAALADAGTLSHQPLSPILTTCRARGVGENVAYGSVTPEQLVRLWMDSPGHRANLLNPSFTHLGVGAVQTTTGRVWSTQVFLAA